MPAIKKTADTSGALLWEVVSGGPLRGILTGLKVDNPSAYDEKIELLDCFSTDAVKTTAAGAAQAAEDFASQVASGKIKLQMTVPSGNFESLGKEDLEEITFLGKAYIRGSTTTSDCVVVAQYKLA